MQAATIHSNILVGFAQKLYGVAPTPLHREQSLTNTEKTIVVPRIEKLFDENLRN